METRILTAIANGVYHFQVSLLDDGIKFPLLDIYDDGKTENIWMRILNKIHAVYHFFFFLLWKKYVPVHKLITYTYGTDE